MASSAYDYGYAGAERTAPANGLEKLGGDIYDWADNAMTGNLDWRRETILNDVNNAFNAQQAQLARDFNAEEAQKARDFNAEEAQKQRDYEREMAANAYSLKIADLRKNGINPYVALGSGASVPQGAAASGYSASGSAASSSGAHASRSGQGIASALVTIITSAFRLAASSDTPDNYTDYYSDKSGNIRGSRTRIYG